MIVDRPHHCPRSAAGPSPVSASVQAGGGTFERFRIPAAFDTASWHRSVLAVAFTVLATGIGLSCVVASVPDGHSARSRPGSGSDAGQDR